MTSKDHQFIKSITKRYIRHAIQFHEHGNVWMHEYSDSDGHKHTAIISDHGADGVNFYIDHAPMAKYLSVELAMMNAKIFIADRIEIEMGKAHVRMEDGLKKISKEVADSPDVGQDYTDMYALLGNWLAEGITPAHRHKLIEDHVMSISQPEQVGKCVGLARLFNHVHADATAQFCVGLAFQCENKIIKSGGHSYQWIDSDTFKGIPKR